MLCVSISHLIRPSVFNDSKNVFPFCLHWILQIARRHRNRIPMQLVNVFDAIKLLNRMHPAKSEQIASGRRKLMCTSSSVSPCLLRSNRMSEQNAWNRNAVCVFRESGSHQLSLFTYGFYAWRKLAIFIIQVIN